METLRYVLALMMLAMLPGAVLFWFSIHPFIHFWRRFPVRLVLALHYCALLVLAVGIAWFGRGLLTVEYGTHWALFASGLLLLVVAVWFRRVLQRELSNARLTGAPELDPQRSDNLLLRTGVYARMRHPRYLQIFVVLLGWSLMVNFLAIYALVAAYLCVLMPLVWCEERELEERFGEDYRTYRREVPWRFVPGWI